MSQFHDAMAKMQVLGQNTNKLIDCSDVVPVPKPFNQNIKFPASFSKKDLQLTVIFSIALLVSYADAPVSSAIRYLSPISRPFLDRHPLSRLCKKPYI